MAAVAFGCKWMRWELYLPSAVTMIVGLHYYPLARLFRNPIHYATGTSLVAWAAASAVTVPADHRQGVSTLGTGAILWASAAVTLGRAMRAMRVGEVVARTSLPADRGQTAGAEGYSSNARTRDMMPR
jgi:hypothetical protein